MKTPNANIAALALALAASAAAPLHAAPASPAPAPSASQLQEVEDVSLDEMTAIAGYDWNSAHTASISVTAEFEEDRTLYNLDERETERLIADYEKELEQALERRAGLTVVKDAPGSVHIAVAITDVDVNLPQSARFSARSTARTTVVSRWNGSLEVEGQITAQGGNTVLATFQDDVDDEDAFYQRQSTISVRSDMARLADRSANNIARSLEELKGG